MSTILQRITLAEGAMRTSRNPPQSDADIEIARVVKYMAKNNFTEAPEGADPALVAMILDLNNRI